MKKVIIFGASGNGLDALYSLDDRKFQVIVFFDNNKEIQGKKFHGYDVDTPEHIMYYDFDYVILPLADYEEEMKKQLREAMYRSGKIIDENQMILYRPNVGEFKWEESRIAMLRRCAEEIREKHIQGNLAELGVYKGEFAKYLNQYFPEKKLYLFDTFSGFDKKDKSDVDIRLESGHTFSDGSVEEVLNKMVRKESCVIRKGYFPDTAAGLEEEVYCLVSLDADLYKPTLAGLEYFYPRLCGGGYIFIHDFGTYTWGNGVKSAVREYCAQNQISYVPILDRCGSVIITK